MINQVPGAGARTVGLSCTRPGSRAVTTMLTTTRQRRGNVVVVTAEGEVDLSTAAQFAAALADTGPRDQLVVADLDALRFLGSAGLAVLVSAAAEGTRLVVVAGEGSAARRALTVTGLDQVLAVARDHGAALEDRP